MREIAPNLWQLSGFPPHAINIYVIGNVLIDAGTKFAKNRIMRQIKNHPIKLHALTHGHGDHVGGSHAICTELHLPLWCGEHDADAVESGDVFKLMPNNRFNRLQTRLMVSSGHPVSRRLKEGDEVGGFTVLDAPGHSPGHIVYWREKDRVLVLGDVAANINFFTGLSKLGEPPTIFTKDIPRNRESIRKLAALNPAIVCFGHGPPLRDGARFVELANRLPA